MDVEYDKKNKIKSKRDKEKIKMVEDLQSCTVFIWSVFDNVVHLIPYILVLDLKALIQFYLK